MYDDLTDKQAEVLDYLIEWNESGAGCPTLRELARAFGYRSTQAVRDHLAALQRKGYLRRRQGVSRGIELTEEVVSRRRGIPIVGRVAAGTPITAVENLEGYLDFQDMFTPARGELFCLEVHGDSMIDAGIWQGDYCIVRQQPRVDNGQIGVAVVDGEATVKRIYVKGPRIRLVPENEAYEAMEFDMRESDVTIAGKVVGVYRDL